MATKPPGLYVPLDVDYADDEAVESLSPIAELLYIRCLAEAKKSPLRAGFLTFPVIVAAAGTKVRRPRSCIEELVTSGLLVPAERNSSTGWRIRGWAKWNMTEDQADKRRQDRVRGGFIRAHRAGQHRSETAEGCPECEATSSGGSSATSSGGSSAKRKKKTESSSKTLSRPASGAGAPGGSTPPGTRVPSPDDYDRYGEYRPLDYLVDPENRHEGGWDGPNAWIQPSMWREGWAPPKRDSRADR